MVFAGALLQIEIKCIYNDLFSFLDSSAFGFVFTGFFWLNLEVSLAFWLKAPKPRIPSRCGTWPWRCVVYINQSLQKAIFSSGEFCILR